MQELLDLVRFERPTMVGKAGRVQIVPSLKVVRVQVVHPDTTWTWVQFEPAQVSFRRDGYIPQWMPDDPQHWLGVVYLPEGDYKPRIIGFLPWNLYELGTFDQFIEYFKTSDLIVTEEWSTTVEPRGGRSLGVGVSVRELL